MISLMARIKAKKILTEKFRLFDCFHFITKRKKIFHLTNHFLFLIYFIPLFLFINPLQSESYSSHRLDDHLYRNGGGKIPRPISRLTANEGSNHFEHNPKASEGVGIWKYNLYTQSRFRSLRANRKEDRESRYEGYGSLEPELQWNRDGWLRPYIILSPKIGGVEEQRIQKNKTTIYDFEAMVGMDLSSLGVKSHLQFGRGFHRLDSYGFVLAERMNSIDLGIIFTLFNLQLGVSAIAGNFSSDNLTLTPEDWKTNRQTITGGAFFVEHKDRINTNLLIYGYQMISPKLIPDTNKNLERGEDSKYIGADSRFLLHDFGLYLELGGTSQHTKEDFYLSNLFQSETTLKRILFNTYGKIGWIWEYWTFESSVLIQSKDGYRPMNGAPRYMGGASSILLGWTSLGGVANIDKRGMEMVGLYLDKKWNLGASFGWHTSLYVNTANLEFGRGYEGILHATKLGIAGIFNPKSFILGSVAYAKVFPREKISPLIDELPEKDSAKEYLKFYLSAGLSF
jgi:hypothetical protein